jgi:acyl-CoA dehydrogenase
MDFTLSPDIEDLRLRVHAFIEKEVLPLEADRKNFSEH